MKMTIINPIAIIFLFLSTCILHAEEKPYITTQTPLTLFSTHDGVTVAVLGFSNVKPYDYKLLAKDSFSKTNL